MRGTVPLDTVYPAKEMAAAKLAAREIVNQCISSCIHGLASPLVLILVTLTFCKDMEKPGPLQIVQVMFFVDLFSYSMREVQRPNLFWEYLAVALWHKRGSCCVGQTQAE